MPRQRRVKGASYRSEQRIAAQRRQPATQTERHVHWAARIMRRAAAVRRGTPAGSGLAPGPSAAPTPSSDTQLELSRGAAHFD
jgi:hypothetical protein